MKHVPRFYVTSDLRSGEEITLDVEQMHHAHVVLRADIGDAVRVFNGRDGEWNCRISNLKKNTVVCSNQEREQRTEQGTSVVCPLINPNKFSVLIEKITELGVTNIFPIITQYTQYKDLNKRKAEQIIIHACEQSGRLTLPQLHDVAKLSDFLQNYKGQGRILVGDERLGSTALRDMIDKNDIFLIGPEGGFSDSEFELFEQSDFIHLFSFGKNILRSETSAVAFVSVWDNNFLQ